MIRIRKHQGHRSHRDDNPVEASRDGGETRALIDLNEVAEAGKMILTMFILWCQTWQR